MSPMDALTDRDGKPLFLLQSRQQFFCLVLEVAILRRPLRVERSVENLLQLDPCVRLPVIVKEQLGEEEVRRGVVVVVLQRFAQMLLCKLVVAPKETRHFVVPASERTIRGSLLKCGVEAQHGEQRILDWLAVLDALPDTKRFGERTHIG